MLEKIATIIDSTKKTLYAWDQIKEFVSFNGAENNSDKLLPSYRKIIIAAETVLQNQDTSEEEKKKLLLLFLYLL